MDPNWQCSLSSFGGAWLGPPWADLRSASLVKSWLGGWKSKVTKVVKFLEFILGAFLVSAQRGRLGRRAGPLLF